MKKTMLLAAMAVFGWLTPCRAMTGAELLQSGRDFAYGYVYGITEYRITVLAKDDPTFLPIRNCIMASNANSETLFQVVAQRLKTHPDELAMPALGSILNALNDMCVRK